MQKTMELPQFQALVVEHHTAVWAQSVALLGDAAFASRTTRDAFLAAWRNRHQLHGPEQFWPWMRSITDNQCWTVRLMLGREPRAGQSDEDDRVVFRPGGWDEWVGVWALLGALDPKAREAMVLFSALDRAGPETAALLDITANTLRQRLRRGFAALAEDGEELLHEAVLQARPGASEIAALLAEIGGQDEPAASMDLPHLARPHGGLCGSAFAVALLALALWGAAQPGATASAQEGVPAPVPEARAAVPDPVVELRAQASEPAPEQPAVTEGPMSIPIRRNLRPPKRW
jgi:DNA-directed RNA polymerase specialized sigma24 family protein